MIDQYASMIDLLEDREDELDAPLGRRIREEREAYARGEGRDFQAVSVDRESILTLRLTLRGVLHAFRRTESKDAVRTERLDV